MTPSLLVFDDFHPKPFPLREAVIASPFGKQVCPADGIEYDGVGLHPDDDLVALVEGVVGSKIKPSMKFWRLALEGEYPESAVHADNVGTQWAGVFYLGPPDVVSGGTAFWTHKTLGFDRDPAAGASEEFIRGYQSVYQMFYADWWDLTKWEQTGFVAAKFNRLVLYPSAMVHSRWPLEGWGTTAADGRLTWVVFFDLEERED